MKLFGHWGGWRAVKKYSWAASSVLKDSILQFETFVDEKRWSCSVHEFLPLFLWCKTCSTEALLQTGSLSCSTTCSSNCRGLAITTVDAAGRRR